MFPTFRADLHCHSTCSDGSLTPVELVRLAKEKSLQGLAITDHDNVTAYTMAKDEAKLLNIALLPGVEFSSQHNNQNVHILGYSFQLDHPQIQALCRWHLTRRWERCQSIIERLSTLGLPLTSDDVADHAHGGLVGRPHIAAAMLKKGFVGSMKEAFQLYLGDGKAAYVPGESISAEETIQALHLAGGVAVIAHPHLIQDPRLFDSLVQLPFDGIEVFYARFHVDQTKRWEEAAKKRNWLITGGSDFHGSIKPDLPLGASWVGEEPFRKLAQLCQ